MREKKVFYDTEKTVGKYMRRNAAGTVPPFAGIAERIAAGEPAESFEEFFAGDILPVGSKPARGKLPVSLSMAAALSAAALILFVGGGITLGAVFGGGAMDQSKAAAHSAVNEEEKCENIAETGNAAAENDDVRLDQNVSDSDMDHSTNEESADTSE